MKRKVYEVPRLNALLLRARGWAVLEVGKAGRDAFSKRFQHEGEDSDTHMRSITSSKPGKRPTRRSPNWKTFLRLDDSRTSFCGCAGSVTWICS